MNYIYVLIATVLLAVEFAFSKIYQAAEGVSLRAGLRFNALSGLVSAMIMWALCGFKPGWSPLSAVLSVSMTLCGLCYSLLSFRVLKNGGMALYSIFLMSGGMLLPYLFGLLFLNEQLRILRVVGVLVILAGVVCSNTSRDQISKKLLTFCIAVFILNGCVSIISKCHQISTVSTVSTSAFVMYAGIAKCLFCTVALLLSKKGAETAALQKKCSVLIIAGGAVIGALSYFLQLVGAAQLPASVLYPMVTGGSIIFSALAGVILFKERLSRLQLVSIILCFMGTLLFL